MDIDNLYKMIFKRKSFHLFRGADTLSEDDMRYVSTVIDSVTPLYPDIKVKIHLVKESDTTCKRGAEYCILIYSETKDNYLQNVGYIGEQMDLALVQQDIGVLWYGIGKVNELKIDGLDYVIMLAIAKMPKDKFRVDMYKSKRKALEEIWLGERYLDVGDIVRFAPSACNTQPWEVHEEGYDLIVYRYKKSGKRGIMPVDKVVYYNRIDIGIFMLMLEVVLKNKGIDFDRYMYVDDDIASERVKIAKYTIKKS